MLMALCLPVAMNDLESSSIIPGVSSLTEDTLRLGEVRVDTVVTLVAVVRVVTSVVATLALVSVVTGSRNTSSSDLLLASSTVRH